MTSQQFQQVYSLRADSQHKIHMDVKVEVSTKEYSKEFSNTLLGYTIKWKRHVILRGMWPVKDKLLSFGDVNAHFIIASPVTNVSKFISQGAIGMFRNE